MARKTWLTIFVIYATGVLASAQVGKLSALMPLMQRDLALDLTAAALLVSLIEAGGASLGLVAGTAVRRFGFKRALMAGVGLLAVAGLCAAQASDAWEFFIWRSLESAGYLAVVVAAPTLMAVAAGPADRRTALALWTTFFPVGFALGSMAAGAAADWLSWRAALAGSGMLAVLMLLAASGLPACPDSHRGKDAGHGRLPAGAWYLSLGFGCYTSFEVGMLAMLPAYFTGQAGVPASTAGLVTGLASLATIAGAVCAVPAIRSGRGSTTLTAAGIALPAAMLFAVFAPAGDWRLAAAVAILANAVSGIVPALTFARLPDVAGSAGNMAVANGLIAQCGAAGSLIGPPLLAACAVHWGWPSAAAAGAAASLICAGFLAAAGRRPVPARGIGRRPAS
ncbi:MAG TPA: MFS transporter [Alphaproteobacteria bacterium]|nr:MFS transporter [Alphaproteobacteria bacterium]